MLFSRSYTLLRSACGRIDGATNFIFKNSSQNTRSFANSLSKISKDKISVTEIFKLPEDATRKDTDVDRLKNDTSMLRVVNNEEQKLSNTFSESSNIEVLKRNTHEFSEALEDVDTEPIDPLGLCTEDLSDIVAHETPTFNFAKYANTSKTLQHLVNLGVKLYKFEKERDLVEMYLTLDFDKDIKPYLQFLHDCGVPSESLGDFITKNPRIVKEDMDDLHTRIRYLRAHQFIPEMISLIMIRNPCWLSFSTKEIDYRLGHFQNTFQLSGYQLRCLAVKTPKLITYKMQHIRENTFAVKEEMGFSLEEMQNILLKAPRVWIHARNKVLSSFNYAHNHMKLSHEILSRQPKILTCRKVRLRLRHEFLVHLKKNQYDPSKPLYVSPLDIITGTDVEFCKNVAKASIDTFNMFQKTL